jgi:WD40 repeat protein
MEHRNLGNSAQPNDFQDLFQTGGTIKLDSPVYVVRKADEDLYQNLKKNNFCYVFASRQMGKSSLRVRTMKRLEDEGYRCIFIDISAMGSKSSLPDKWYYNFLYPVAKAFSLLPEFKNFWKSNYELTAEVRMHEFFKTIVFQYVAEPIVIFIDEIDSMLSLDPSEFSTDDFFAALRYFFNVRSDFPEFNRLNFALLGVASANDLMHDAARTPFNIGVSIIPENFSMEQAKTLQVGFQHLEVDAEKLLEAILFWTNGQPYFTQTLCKSIAEQETDIEDIQEVVSKHVSFLFLTKFSIDHDHNLSNTQKRILENKEYCVKMLSIYQQILAEEKYPVSLDDVAQIYLKLSGLVHEKDGYLYVNNRIYSTVFDQAWVVRSMESVDRPYSHDITFWLDNNRSEKSALAGAELEKAIEWYRNRNDLSNLEKEYFNFLLDKKHRIYIRKSKVQLILLYVILPFFVGFGAWDYFSRAYYYEESLRTKKSHASALQEKDRAINQLGSDLNVTSKLYYDANNKITQINEKFNQSEQNYVVLRSTNDEVRREAEANHSLLDVLFTKDPLTKMSELSKVGPSMRDEKYYGVLYSLFENFYLGKNFNLNSKPSSLFYNKNKHRLLLTSNVYNSVEVFDVERNKSLYHHSVRNIIGSNFTESGDEFFICTDSLTRHSVSGAKIWSNPLPGLGFSKAYFSPGNKRLLLFKGNEATLVDISTMLVINKINFSPNKIIDVQFAADESKFAVAVSDKSIELFDIAGKPLKVIAFDDNVRAFQFWKDNDNIIAGLADRKIVMIRCSDKTIVGGFVSGYPINGLKISPFGNYIAVRALNEYIQIYNSQGFRLGEIKSKDRNVVDYVIDNEGQTIFSINDARNLQAWNIKGIELWKEQLPSNITCVCMLSDNIHFFAGCENGSIYKMRWDGSRAPALVMSIKEKIKSINVSKEQKHIAISTYSDVGYFYDLRANKLVHSKLFPSLENIYFLNEDVAWVVSGNLFVLYSFKSGMEAQSHSLIKGILSASEISDDGSLLAISMSEHKIRVLDRNKREVWGSDVDKQGVLNLAFVGNNEKIAYPVSRTLKICPLNPKATPVTIDTDEAIVKIKGSSKNKAILVAYQDNSIRLISSVRNYGYFRYPSLNSNITSLLFSPDGNRFLVSTANGYIYVWNIVPEPTNIESVLRTFRF